MMKSSITMFFFNKFKRLFGRIVLLIKKIDNGMDGKYTPSSLALFAVILAGLLVTVMLFTPPYLGMSDDGSFSRIMNSVGIYAEDDSAEELTYNYYLKDYVISRRTTTAPVSSTVLFARAALMLDNLITRDGSFDMRFLGLIYTVFFLLGLYLLIRNALERVNGFSEGVSIAVLGVVIFTDVAYVTYFCSFYSEPVMIISLMLCTGSALSLSREGHDLLWLLVFLASGLALTFAKCQCAIAGLFLSWLPMRMIFIKKSVLWKIACVFVASALLFGAVCSYKMSYNDFTLSSKFHAMTRGVLFQATDPPQALGEFGIDSSFEVLADVSSNDEYPFTQPDNEYLQDNFYGKYDSFSVALYYARHINAMFAMLDIAVRSSMNQRKDFSGNYELSTGHMPKAKSLFWSAWSSYKTNSAPQTVGFLIILIAGAVIVFHKQLKTSKRRGDSRAFMILTMLLIVTLIGVSQAVIAIVNSGDAELQNRTFLLCMTIDLLIFYIISELLCKLKILG